MRLIEADVCVFCKCKNDMFFHFGSLVRRKQSVGAVLEFNGAISGRGGIIVNRQVGDGCLHAVVLCVVKRYAVVGNVKFCSVPIIIGRLLCL